jgi:hypothetical protein
MEKYKYWYQNDKEYRYNDLPVFTEYDNKGNTIKEL